MKKGLLFLLMLLSANNVFACGELKSITSSVGKLAKTGDTTYTVTVPKGTTTVSINATSDYPFLTNYGPRTVSTSQMARLRVDGESCGGGIVTYFINFKEETPVQAPTTKPNQNENTNQNNTQNSAQNNTTTQSTTTANKGVPVLEGLIISGTMYSFKEGQTEFKYDVPYDTTSLIINAVTSDTDDTIEISNNINELELGENTVTIKITGKNKKVSNYILKVTRSAVSSNNNIASLNIVGSNIEYNKNVTAYNIKIDKTDKLNISVVTEDSKATYNILNNYNLKDGSQVTIRVNAEDGTSKDYTITVKFNFGFTDIIPYIIYGLVILLIVLLLIIIRKRAKKTKLVPPKPEKLEAKLETAGEIKRELDNVQVQSAPIESVPVQQKLVELQYITPTDIEESEIELPKQVENNDTEIFKL